jgi:hypothetical protein
MGFQEQAEVAGCQAVHATVLGRQPQHALANACVVSPVSDEVEYVPVTSIQRRLQVPPRLTPDPVQLHAAGCLETDDRLRQPTALVIGIEGVELIRSGDHGEDAQRRRHRHRPARLEDVDVPDERSDQTEVVVTTGVVEELPGQRGQLRRIHAQPHAQRLALLGGLLTAGDELRPQFGRKHEIEEPAPELPNGKLALRRQPSRRRGRAQ